MILKWTKALNVRAKIIILLEINVGINLCDLGLDNTTNTKKTKTNNNNNNNNDKPLDFIKIKTLVHRRTPSKK